MYMLLLVLCICMLLARPASSVQMVKEPNVNHIGLPVKEDLGHMVNQENAVYRPHTSTNPQKTTSSARYCIY